MNDLTEIKILMEQRGIDPTQDGLEVQERKEIKQAYYVYAKALREGKSETFVKRAHQACLAAIAAFDKTQSKSNQLEELLG